MIFLGFYNQILKTNYQSESQIPFSLNKVNCEKGEVITHYGQVENQIYFINEGIIEIKIKSYTTEKIIDFFFENEMTWAATSFIMQIPSDVQIIALTHCEIEMIKHEELMHTYQHSFDANKFGRIATEGGYIRKSNREKDFLSKTAEKLYVQMLTVLNIFFKFQSIKLLNTWVYIQKA